MTTLLECRPEMALIPPRLPGAGFRWRPTVQIYQSCGSAPGDHTPLGDALCYDSEQEAREVAERELRALYHCAVLSACETIDPDTCFLAVITIRGPRIATAYLFQVDDCRPTLDWDESSSLEAHGRISASPHVWAGISRRCLRECGCCHMGPSGKSKGQESERLRA